MGSQLTLPLLQCINCGWFLGSVSKNKKENTGIRFLIYDVNVQDIQSLKKDAVPRTTLSASRILNVVTNGSCSSRILGYQTLTSGIELKIIVVHTQ
jgi:hypothetical protein